MQAEEEGRTCASLIYTGEVYNFVELRDELRQLGHRFKTRSDTEVVLRGYLQWGDKVVERLNGMFAFAIWDVRTEELLLVRDRMGVKPLFYYPTADGVLFGSEPKAILAHPTVQPRVNKDGFREILVLAKNPESTIYAGMHEVRPGQVVRVNRNGLTKRRYCSRRMSMRTICRGRSGQSPSCWRTLCGGRSLPTCRCAACSPGGSTPRP
jgi:asparagine synthase (glutamine-hydrolysing)